MTEILYRALKYDCVNFEGMQRTTNWLFELQTSKVEISFEMESLFFSLMKRTKNQGCGIVVKARISISCEISLRGALFCSLLKSLILSVIFFEASDKPLAFQFTNKTQQSQGQRQLWIRIDKLPKLKLRLEIRLRKFWGNAANCKLTVWTSDFGGSEFQFVARNDP